jgi:hypothetical protein
MEDDGHSKSIPVDGWDRARLINSFYSFDSIQSETAFDQMGFPQSARTVAISEATVGKMLRIKPNHGIKDITHTRSALWPPIIMKS